MAMGDWTEADGRSNSSPEFLRCCKEVERLLLAGAGGILQPGWLSGSARLIVAQLAHVHHLAPWPPVSPERIAALEALEDAAYNEPGNRRRCGTVHDRCGCRLHVALRASVATREGKG